MSLLVIPKLPMLAIDATSSYLQQVFQAETKAFGNDYLIATSIYGEFHFFRMDFDPLQNYGQVYIRIEDKIEEFYSTFLGRGATLAKFGQLAVKPWGLAEFALLDPNHNLYTFGQELA